MFCGERGVGMSGEICNDNRFEIIAAYKKKLIECTNIETSPEEMSVIDNILFRFWQMNWLPTIPHGRLIDADALDDGFTDLRWENGDYKNGTLMHWGDRPHWCLTGKEIEDLINAAPTIIDAEEGK